MGINKAEEFRFEAGDDIKERVMKKLEEGVKALYESEHYADYLRTMGQFHKYSINNNILLYLQKPDVKAVAGFRAWQDKFGRTVKKGERGLKIFVPHPYKEEVIDEKTGIVTEIDRLRFGIGTVFDVSQTEGREINLDKFPYRLPDGNYDRFDEIRSAIEQVAGIPVDYVPTIKESGGAEGVYKRSENRIEILDNLSQEATLSVLIHEVAHSILHDDLTELKERGATRRTVEVEAESVSFVVCDHLGIDTTGSSFGYVAGWSKNKTLPELQSSTTRIHETAHKMIQAIEDKIQPKAKTLTAADTKETTIKASKTRGRH